MLNTKSLFVIALVLLFSVQSNIYAQKRMYDPKGGGGKFYGDKYRDAPLYKWQGFYRRTGLHFSLGPSVTLTRLNNPTLESASGDTTFSTTLDPSSRLGYYAKVGALHIFKFKKKVFQYIDYGIGIKQISGAEALRFQSFDDRGELIGENELEGKFGLGYAFFDFNINNVIQITRYNFIQNSLGLNVDYRVYSTGDEAYQGVYNSEITNQERLVAQLHYKFGFGIKLRDGLFLIPSVETPILTGYHWDGLKPMTRWFDSRYQPLYFSLELAFLFKKNPEDCPPVYGPEDDKWRDSQHQQGGGK